MTRLGRFQRGEDAAAEPLTAQRQERRRLPTARGSREFGPCYVPVRGVVHGDPRSFTEQPAARLTCAAAGAPVAVAS